MNQACVIYKNMYFITESTGADEMLHFLASAASIPSCWHQLSTVVDKGSDQKQATRPTR